MILNWLKKHKLKHLPLSEDAKNVQISCPMCSDTRFRLGINIKTGKMNCFNCGFKVAAKTPEKNIQALENSMIKLKSGKLSTQKTIEERKATEKIKIDTSLGLKCYQQGKLKGKLAQKYLKVKRGLSQKTIDYFKLGSRTKFKGKGLNEYVSIPYWEDGQCVNVKYRCIKTVDKKFKWRREVGGKSALYNCDVINDHQYKTIMIFEAELDMLSAWSNGIKNCVSLTVGAGGFKQEWYDQLERFEKIYICLDTDEAGRDGSKELAKRLGMDRCYNVVLPKEIKDVNEFFWDSKNRCQRYSITDFLECVKKAKRYEVESLTHTKDMFLDTIKEIESPTQTYEIKSKHKNINQLTGGGYRPGHLIVLAARAKCGKSSYAFDEMLHLAKSGTTCLMYQCEMDKTTLARNLVRMTDPEYEDINTITSEMLRRTLHRIPHERMKFFYPKIGDFSLETVEQNITDAVKRYNCKFVVFDNLLFLSREIKEFSDMRDKVGKVTQRFKLLAMSLGITIMLITHPRKVTHNGPLSPDDLKESSSIFQDLDHLILLHREKLDAHEDDPTLSKDDLEVLKDLDMGSQLTEYEDGMYSSLVQVDIISRHGGGGRCYMYFNTQIGRMYSDNKSYRLSMENLMKRRNKKDKEVKRTGKK